MGVGRDGRCGGCEGRGWQWWCRDGGGGSGVWWFGVDGSGGGGCGVVGGSWMVKGGGFGEKDG